MAAPAAYAAANACARCARPLAAGSTYLLGGEARCLRCALRQRSLLVRSARTALLVGSILVVINHGTALVAGAFSQELLWKAPLTYMVPFIVATWGALGAVRR